MDKESLLDDFVKDIQESKSSKNHLGKNIPPVDLPDIDLIVYRPGNLKASYLGNAPLSEAQEDKGVKIRTNVDDDNENSLSDRFDIIPTENEDDLVKIELKVSAPAPEGYHYRLVRSNENISVWKDSPTRDYLLIGNDKAAPISFAEQAKVQKDQEQFRKFFTPFFQTELKQTFWVESRAKEAAELEFQLCRDSDGKVMKSDKAKFAPSNTLISMASGEKTPKDGMYDLAKKLYQEGYNVLHFDEDEIGTGPFTGSNKGYDEVFSQIKSGMTDRVILIGYSHGGGSIHDLAEALNNSKAELEKQRGGKPFEVPLTVYVDAIQDFTDIEQMPEYRLPPGTQKHLNFYQENSVLKCALVRGCETFNSTNIEIENYNVNKEKWGKDLNHCSIPWSGEVQKKIKEEIDQVILSEEQKNVKKEEKEKSVKIRH